MTNLFNEDQIAHLLNFQTEYQNLETLFKSETKHTSAKTNRRKKNSVENIYKEEKNLIDAIRSAYCDLYTVKDMSLIKKMSPLEMMTKIDIMFENLVNHFIY